MTKWFRGFFLLAVISALIAGCSTGGVETPGTDNGNHIINNRDTLAPVLDITNPGADQVFSSGNIIAVTGRITDENGLYRGSVRITDDANGYILKEQQYEIHGVLSYDFSVTYTTAVTSVSNYTVTVWFEDHGLNKTTKTVKIKVNP